MSTVHEALTAHHCGIEVVAFSLITNICILERDRYGNKQLPQGVTAAIYA